MGHRLSKIITKTGDDGTTGLGDGSRVAKDHLRVEAFGTVDELNSQLGLLLSYTLPEAVTKDLTQIQHHLFDLGSELCVPGYERLEAKHTEFLEAAAEKYNADLPMLKEFILPGGSAIGAQCHVARTVCRRAERRVVSLRQQESINIEGVQYLNRLSDLLFILARYLLRQEGKTEVLWSNDH